MCIRSLHVHVRKELKRKCFGMFLHKKFIFLNLFFININFYNLNVKSNIKTKKKDAFTCSFI